MSELQQAEHWSSEDGVREDLQRQQHIFFKLAENALSVAESLRENYFKNTASFVAKLRKRMDPPSPILSPVSVGEMTWSDVKDEVVTFIDGGVGQVQISSQFPILVRVGSYCVRTGDHRIAQREQFGYYPVILGDLEGGSKERKDFVDIVRITAELLGGLSALERTPDLRVLMFHGPLVYVVGHYTEHTPFTEHDIDLFLGQYATDSQVARDIKEEFLHEAELHIYPRMARDWAEEWNRERVFEPLALMAYLYRRLIRQASLREPVPIIAGVVERGDLHEFAKNVLLERVFQGLREHRRTNYFNEIFGRHDLTSPEAMLSRLGYTDALLLAMLLKPGQASEAWEITAKFAGLHGGMLSLPGKSVPSRVDWAPLVPPSQIGFPPVQGCYVQVTETTEPVRVEVFPALGESQMIEAARRVYLYARLLPGYGFPVGLDIADKYAKVPTWLTDAYGKLIRHHLGVSLQRGEISDSEMRRILVQAIYMTHRDWLFRPDSY